MRTDNVARFDWLFKFVNGWRELRSRVLESQVRSVGGAVAARGCPRRRSPSCLRGPQRSAAAGAVKPKWGRRPPPPRPGGG
jgi:hypothetical protein